MALNNQNEDEEKDKNLNSDSDDTFGLPEIEYEPLKREEPISEAKPEEPVSAPKEVRQTEYSREHQPKQENVNQYKSSYSYMEEEKYNPWPRILGIALVVVVVALGIYWFMAVYKPGQLAEAERRKREQIAKQEESRKKEEERLAELRRQQEEQRKLDSLANVSKVGVVQALTGRTGRYYVVISSDVDDDLLMDYANKLAGKGVSTKIVPPFGKSKFYRLAIDDKDTFADAQSAADAMKGGEYGDKLWVVKY